MAEKIKYAIMQQTRATASEWTATNPVLFEGQLGYDTTNKKFKIGDGSTPWNSLPYFAEKGETGATGATGNGINYTADTTETTTTSLYVSQLVNPTAQIGDLILSANSQLFRVTNIADSLLLVSYLTTLTATAAEAVITSLNGSTTTGRSIYAPTTYGATGYELIATGVNSAPVWKQPSAILQCPTASRTTNKKAYVYGATSESSGSPLLNFKLVKGMVIAVKFTNKHLTTGLATLSIATSDGSSTTYTYTPATQIVWDNSSIPVNMPIGASPTEEQTLKTRYNSWEANETLTLAYDGTYWRIIARDKPSMYSAYRQVDAEYQVTKQVVRMVLPAGKRYLITSTVGVNISRSDLIMNKICVDDHSGNRLVTAMDVRGHAASGGGVTSAFIADCISQTQAVLAYVESYGYMNTTYKLNAIIYAIIIGE